MRFPKKELSSVRTLNIRGWETLPKTEKLKSVAFSRLLTPRDRVLLAALIVALLVKFPAFYGNRRFIAVITKARHGILS
jgi:hypothetical protein